MLLRCPGCSVASVPVRVMIVDDHADVRFLLRAIVDDADEDVTVVGEADGVRAALESIDELDPDVVVLDAVMPVVGGIEAAPMILARRPGQKILLCSAMVDDEVRDQADRAGITECVSKDDMEEIPRIAVALARE
jgi:two-component system LytT family response regulator